MRFNQRLLRPPEGPFTINRLSPQAIGLAGLWPMIDSRGTSGVRSVSGLFDGTVVGTLSWTPSPVTGWSLDFDGSSSRVDCGTNDALNLTGDATWTSWIRPDVITSSRHTIISRRGHSSGGWDLEVLDSSGLKIRITWIGVAVYDSNANVVSAGSWQHIAVVHNDIANTVQFYVNGRAAGSASVGSIVSASGAEMSLGTRRNALDRYFDGQMADVRIYRRALSATEVWQQWDTLTRWDLYLPAQRFWAVRVAGGTTESISVGGTITPVGTLVKQPQTTYGGNLSPAGALIREVQALFAGSVTPTGAAAKQASTAYAGQVDPAGAINNQVNTTLAGSIAPTGALAAAKTIALSVAGSIAPLGNLIRQANRLLVGAITPAGTVAKQPQTTYTGEIEPAGTLDAIKTATLSAAGSIAPIGALIKQVNHLLGGSLSPTGTLAKEAQTSMAGEIEPAAALEAIKTAVLAVAGSITPSGAITWLVSKLLAGEVEPTGNLVKEAQASYGGSVTPAGTLTKLVQKVFGGSIAPAAVLANVRTALLSAGGSITPVGMLVRQINKLVSGQVTPTGALAKVVSATFAGSIALIGTLTTSTGAAVGFIKTTFKGMWRGMFKKMG